MRKNLGLSTADVLAVGAEGSDQVGGGEKAVLEDRIFVFPTTVFVCICISNHSTCLYLYYMQIKFSSIYTLSASMMPKASLNCWMAEWEKESKMLAFLGMVADVGL